MLRNSSSSAAPPSVSIDDALCRAPRISVTRGSWCTNLYFFTEPLVFDSVGDVKPHSRSTIRPATSRPTQTLQSRIQMMSPLASRYARLMFLILGLGPRFRPSDRLGSSSSTSIRASKPGWSCRSCSRIGNEGSSRLETQKNIMSLCRG